MAFLVHSQLTIVYSRLSGQFIHYGLWTIDY